MDSIEIPVWLVLTGSLLAAVALVDRFLTPTVRWFFRRRANAAIEELNKRLEIKIKPFGMTRRQVLIDRLTYDPEVMAAAQSHAHKHNMPLAVALEEARGYAKEIAPGFSAPIYFRIGIRFARWLSTLLYQVELSYRDVDTLRSIDRDASVVFVINHRSNLDYILVTYLAARTTSLSYAVGEWARLPVLQTLVRLMGAYIIRRNDRSALYRKVLARYVQMAIEGGVTQAMFPEGKLSRDGSLLPAKLGLLSYMFDACDPDKQDIVFVPVALNYDFVYEDETLTAESDGRKPVGSPVAMVFKSLKIGLKMLFLKTAGRWTRLGVAAVNIGRPVSMNTLLNQHGQQGTFEREEMVERLGLYLMGEVAREVPATPMALLCHQLLDTKEQATTVEVLETETKALANRLRSTGVHVVQEVTFDQALTMLKRRQLILIADGVVSVDQENRALIAYYANSIAHHMQGEAQASISGDDAAGGDGSADDGDGNDAECGDDGAHTGDSADVYNDADTGDSHNLDQHKY